MSYTYTFKYDLKEKVYAYNESTDEIIAIGEVVAVNDKEGTYTIEDIAFNPGEDITIFHTCVYKVGTGPIVQKQQEEKSYVNELNELNPKAYDNICGIVKEEFQFLAQHMIENADEYFYEEVSVKPETEVESEAAVKWLQEQVSKAIADVIKNFKSQL